MSWTLYQSVLWLHIFLAIIWVGGLLFVGWGVFPAVVRSLALRAQRETLLAIMKHSHLIFTSAGAGVIITGVLLGTVLGPIRSMETVFQTTYGQRWLAALLIGIFTLSWGTFIGYRQTVKVLTNDLIWNMAEKGYPRFLIHKLIFLILVSGVEGFGFVVLLTIMLL